MTINIGKESRGITCFLHVHTGIVGSDTREYFMDNDFKKLLASDNYYVLRQEDGSYFLDKQNTVYLFGSKDDAENHIEIEDKLNKKKIIINEAYTIIDIAKFIQELDGIGCETVCLKKDGATPYVRQPLGEIKKRRYSNKIAENTIVQYSITKKRKYLQKLGNCTFLIPQIIPQREKGSYPSIKYAFASDQNENLGIIFTTLDKLKIWQDKLPEPKQNIQVIEMAFLSYYASLTNLNKGKTMKLIINPGSENLIVKIKDILI